MANIFKFGKSNITERNLQSTTFISNRGLVKIKEEEVLKIPTVKSAVELISNSIAQLPIYLYKEDEEENVIKIKQDYRVGLLNEISNKYSTGNILKKKIVEDYLLYGKSYIYKDEQGFLHNLSSKDITEENFTADNITIGRKEYVYNGISSTMLTEEQVIEIDSGTRGALVDSSELFSIAIETLYFQKTLLDNSAIPTGILQSAARLTEPAIERLRKSWNALYNGSRNSGKTIILEEGLNYKPLALSPNDMQVNEINKHLVSEICRIFNIPESMLNSDANKYASNEQNLIQFLQNCLAPIISSIELSLAKEFLTDEEKQDGYYFRFDTSEILKTTEVEKITAITTALKSGIYSFNEARAKLDLHSVDDDYFVLGLGDVLKDSKTNKITVLNLGQNIDMSKTTTKGSEKE